MAQVQNHMQDFYIFKPSSQLYKYISSRHSMTKLFPLYYLIFVMKLIFKKENMYDETNSVIVVCSAELENIFDKKFLYVRELCKNLKDHIVRLPEKYQKCVKAVANETHIFPQFETAPNQNLVKIVPGFSLFSISHDLRNVFKTLPFFNNSESVYSYSDLLYFLSRYILKNHHKLLDTRNPKIAYVKNDLLGKAFRVNVFHRGQILNLLQRGNFTLLLYKILYTIYNFYVSEITLQKET